MNLAVRGFWWIGWAGLPLHWYGSCLLQDGGEQTERKRGRGQTESERREEQKKSKSTIYSLPFRQTRCLLLHAESYQRSWLIHSSPFSLSQRMVAISAHTECRVRRKAAENDNAPGHSTWKGKRRRNKWARARETHWRARFIKVQVQDWSDFQVALFLWFHINVVSFLPLFICAAPCLTALCCLLIF